MNKIIILFLFFSLLIPASVSADKIWQISSVDTMKYSRDLSRDQKVKIAIPLQVKAASDLGVTHIAISTPYDDEFIPILTLWVDEARKNNLKVWFRGNFSGWEGWFDYPKLTSVGEHHQKTYRFITQNPQLFEDGDLFVPAPEAENGILGDPRRTGKKDEFNKFLISSYDNCQKAFKEIGKDVNCGIWSLNTDVVRETVYKDTVKKLGGVISIDHYTKTPEKLIEDVTALKKQFEAKVVLGEFGAPIPDINGSMTEKEQGQYMADLMDKIYLEKDLIYGLNYWVLNGGSTHLINDDNNPRQAYFEIQKYFQEVTVSGTIIGEFNEALAGVEVKTKDQIRSVKTDGIGRFELSIPVKPNSLIFSRQDLIPTDQTVEIPATKSVQLDLMMRPSNPDFWYKLKFWWNNFTKK